eukprot:5570347-Alexandrium_andersonii.AAC.1
MDGRPLLDAQRGHVTHGGALIFPVWWGEYTYARAVAVFRGVIEDVNFPVSCVPQDRLLDTTQAELRRYAAAVARPDWFEAPDR